MTNKMETAFYHDDNPSIPNFGQVSDFEGYQSQKMMGKKNMIAQNYPDMLGSTSELKLMQGLPANSSNLNANSTGINNTSSSIIAASDMNLLKLQSPDLEQLMIQSNQGLITANPGPNCAGNTFLYRNQVTNEQDGFTDGFDRALADLNKQNQLVGASISPSSAIQASYHRNIMSTGELLTYTNMNSYSPTQITGSASYLGSQLPFATAGHCSGHSGQGQGSHSQRRGLDAVQIVPEMPHPLAESTSSPKSLSPIDMESQERIKAERKRIRNRIAASKCRKRKLERISRLEERVKALKTQNFDLASAASVLRDQVAQLKEKVTSHVNSGCQIVVAKRGGT